MTKTPVESLAEALRLYETYGLVAGNAEAGSWINNARAALIAARPHVQEMSMRLPEASAADCAETLDQIEAALNQEAWVAALLNSPNPEQATTPAVSGVTAEVLRILQASSCFSGDVCALLPCACAETLAKLHSPLRDQANYKIGRWLSAALEDPNVCAEMKADISEWFEVFCTCGGDLKQLPEHHDISCPAALSLTGCLHPGNEPNSCQYEGECLSMACNHHGKTWYGPRMTLEAQDPSLLYPPKETP